MAEPATNPAANVVPVEPPKPPVKRLAESKFSLSTYATNRWSVTLEHGVSYERVFDPDYWSNVARKMRIGDIVELHAEDTTFFAELYVVAAHRLAAKLVELRRFDLAPAVQVAADTSPLTVKYRGPHNRYCLMRGENIVQSGYQTAEEAELAKAQHAKAFAA